MCHYVFMYDGRDKNINSQINNLFKYNQIHIEV